LKKENLYQGLKGQYLIESVPKTAHN